MRVLWPRYDRKVYYFTFGANLDESVLAQRRIKVFAAFDHVLENASLQFTQPGFYDQHGYASADPSDDSVVYGKIYLILERDARRMDYFEGEPFLRVQAGQWGPLLLLPHHANCRRAEAHPGVSRLSIKCLCDDGYSTAGVCRAN